MKNIILTLILVSLLLHPPCNAQAQSSPSCSFEADGSIACTTGGGGGGGGGKSGGGKQNPTPVPCVPGATHLVTIYRPESSLGEGQCSVWENKVLDCTGETVFGGNTGTDECPQAAASQPQHPCDKFSVTSSGITCEASGWNVRARVPFPEINLDVRPYPATLVRWPSAIRNGGQPESSGSGGVNYLPFGGGSPGNPQEGDWRNLRLTLTLRPAGPLVVTLPHIGELMLPNQGATGSPTQIQWEVPSHPAAGGGPLAGSVGGLEELPGDLPLFVGTGRTPYKLFWELRYYVYTAIKGCVAGPGGNGKYNCKGGTGHREIVGYEWKRNSSGGEIPPAAVQNLPVSVMADMNGDGMPDAYWDNNLTLRRMDDNNRVDNPQYQRSWNWGGLIYWGVREGQGQIGWPGQ